MCPFVLRCEEGCAARCVHGPVIAVMLMPRVAGGARGLGRRAALPGVGLAGSGARHAVRQLVRCLILGSGVVRADGVCGSLGSSKASSLASLTLGSLARRCAPSL